MERPSTPVDSSRREEHKTPVKARFFQAFDTGTTTLRQACRDVNVPPSTASKWVKKRKELGEQAIRRTRQLSTTLGRPNKVCDSTLKAILSPSHPSHLLHYDEIAEKENIPLSGRSLRRHFAAIGARRYRKPVITRISKPNKAKRLKYSHEHKSKTLRGFWRWVYFTDEAHFNTRELAAKDAYELRVPGSQARLERLQESPPSFDFTVHVSAGISYDHKGVLLFYNDPDEPGPKEYVYKPRKPRKSKHQTDEEFEQELKAWEARQPPKVDVRPKGNSMTQKFYTQHILPSHIEHIKRLEARYSRSFYFQEDNDPSHGTLSTKNVARQLKDVSQLTKLDHPPQSPDFNPIESIWRAIKQRIRGGRWLTVEAFKNDIEREWRRISKKTIRKRIAEMKWRCEQCIKLNGGRVRSKLW